MKKRVLFSIAAVAVMSMNSCKKEVTTIPVETKDTVVVETKDTTPVWDIDTSDNAEFKEIDLEAQRDSIIKANLQTILFEYNSYALSAEAQDMLRMAAKFLTTTEKGIRVKVTGHTDERGTSDYNMQLGEKRALAVRDFLTRYDVEAFRIEVTSKGRDFPVTPGCDSEACHRENRRAEYTVIK